MKKYLLLLCAIAGGAIAAHTQTIKMKIASLPPVAGETILAYENANGSSVSYTSGSPSISQTIFSEVKIKKASGGYSAELFKRSVNGTVLSEVAFEWYDAANTLFYKVVLRDCYTTAFANLSPECSNCTTLSNEVSFVFRKIELTDVIAGTTIRYDVSTRTTY